jgi:hypothetical protein
MLNCADYSTGLVCGGHGAPNLAVSVISLVMVQLVRILSLKTSAIGKELPAFNKLTQSTVPIFLLG